MSSRPSDWTRLHGIATLALTGAALYFLLVEHTEHILQFLPILILLLCPLMHLFMHKGHRAHAHPKHEDQAAHAAYQRGLQEGRKESSK
ncbi:MAG: DUF2933 domain-containing protein [Algiphilus sp.]